MKNLLHRYGLKSPSQAENLILIGDFLKDLDDEHSLCGIAGLIKLGYVNLLCVVANLAPADFRARGAKGTLQQLGLGSVPVGVGTAVFQGKTHPYELDIPYLAHENEVIADGEQLLTNTLMSAADHSVILVLQSGLTDAALLIQSHPDLFLAKVKLVAIMGGVETEGSKVVTDSRGYLLPNNANNNSFDPTSATYVYHRLQELGVPMVITTREVSYAAQAPLSAYDSLEATGNVVGACLKERQRFSLQHLWEAACSPAGSQIRGTLPSDRNRGWFVKVFCGGARVDIDDSGNIWPFLKSFNLYDPSNIYAAIPELATRFLSPVIHDVNGVQHQIFGLSSSVTGVKDADEFSQFMVDMEIIGLQS